MITACTEPCTLRIADLVFMYELARSITKQRAVGHGSTLRKTSLTNSGNFKSQLACHNNIVEVKSHFGINGSDTFGAIVQTHSAK